MPEPGTISVVGHGRAVGAPDVCRARLMSSALRPSVAAALADSEAAIRLVRDALAAHGVPPGDAVTSTVSVQAEQDWSGQRGPRPLGYRAEHILEIVLRDLGAAGRVLGAAVGAGGDTVRLQGLTFGVEDDSELRAGARAGAWEDALAAAGQVAELAGRRLGAVRGVEQRSEGGPPVRPRITPAAGMAAAPEIGLEPGDVAVDVWLAVVWELD
ncbi:MAG TPA: SIMPL domain-containing protein [Kineosporiaceae bacterium]|nr:SIMPL domain-containing protein [Kineosporiaceae bacterium]